MHEGVGMPEHTRDYMVGLGLSPGDVIVSELTGRPCQDINHLDPRGMGGSKTKNDITKLMALTRNEHEFFELFPEWKQVFIDAHLLFLQERKPLYLTAGKDHQLIKVITEYEQGKT